MEQQQTEILVNVLSDLTLLIIDEVHNATVPILVLITFNTILLLGIIGIMINYLMKKKG